MATKQRLIEVLTTAMEKPDIANALIQRVINTLNKQPEPQETIAKWIKANTEHRQWYICPKCSYQAPRFKDEWVGLTDEEIAELGKIWLAGNRMLPFPLARAIEAKLKEKNT